MLSNKGTANEGVPLCLCCFRYRIYTKFISVAPCTKMMGRILFVYKYSRRLHLSVYSGHNRPKVTI